MKKPRSPDQARRATAATIAETENAAVTRKDLSSQFKTIEATESALNAPLIKSDDPARFTQNEFGKFEAKRRTDGGVSLLRRFGSRDEKKQENEDRKTANISSLTQS